MLNGRKAPQSDDPYYPVAFADTILECFALKVVVDREKTGLQENEHMKIRENMVIAGRYQISAYIGQAAFSKTFAAVELETGYKVCLKMITNKKDYVDQSIDEIKVLRYLAANGDLQDNKIVTLVDYFYFREHLFLVFELLHCNLYELIEKQVKQRTVSLFNDYAVAKIAKQMLIALDFMHSNRVMHCDVKPENIMLSDVESFEIKLIDLGSAAFEFDNVGFYVQSRAYRAPEVILGCEFDSKVDIWSLGCVLYEIYTGNVLFLNSGVTSLLARMMGILGPIPDWMFKKGKKVNEMFTEEKLLFTQSKEGNDKSAILVPKKTTLKKRLKTKNEQLLDFLSRLLIIDPNVRISAKEALEHAFVRDISL